MLIGWLVRGIASVLFHLFLSPAGLVVLAALESTLFFWFPFGIDAAVIVLTVRRPDSVWLYPVLATAGSVLGTLVTFWMGAQLEEKGIERYVHGRRLTSIKSTVKKKGTLTLAALGIVPPPFPFTAFVLAAGALGVDGVRFLGTLAGVRLLRFGLEAVLAAHYGTSVLRWLNSDLVLEMVSAMIGLAIAGSAVSLYVLFRKRRAPSPRAA